MTGVKKGVSELQKFILDGRDVQYNGNSYSIKKVLGFELQGGQGLVCEGEYTEDVRNRPLAYKPCIFKTMDAIPQGVNIDTVKKLKDFMDEKDTMMLVNNDDNVCRIIDFIKFVYESNIFFVIVMEKGKCDFGFYLEHLVDYDANPQFNGRPLAHEVMRQLLLGLNYCHRQGVIHADIKQYNMIIFENGTNQLIKLIDFGLAHKMKNPDNINDVIDDHKAMIQGTLAFMAPEMLYRQGFITCKIDIWAAGCIFLTMITKKQVTYFDGTTVNEMKESIMKFLGTPTEVSWPSATHWILMELEQGPNYPSTVTANLGKLVSGHCIDFVRKVLTYDYNKRLSASEALNHPYLKYK